MEKITQLFISILTVTLISCSSNSPEEMLPSSTTAKVEYKVTSSCDMMVDVWYRDEQGQMTKVMVADSALEWDKIINVKPPFHANISAGFYNTDPDPGNCEVKIFVNDQLVEDYPGSLASSYSYTMFADYHILQ